MKTLLTKIAFTLFLYPFFSVLLIAQSNSGDKKITITKKTMDADGSEITETIVKKGKAADNFDPEAYLKENKTGGTDVDIRVENNGSISLYDMEAEDNVNVAPERRRMRINGFAIESKCQEVLNDLNISCTGTNDKHGFLGVEEDSDEDEDEPGLTIQVIRNSAAAEAGLKTNDVVLKLNETDVNDWSELTAFMGKTKPGEAINITYRRQNATMNTKATLSKQSEVNSKNCHNSDKHGFLGVTEAGNDDSEELGMTVNIVKSSAAEAAGMKNGDILLAINGDEIKDWEDITDAIAGTQVGQKVKISYERNGKKGTTEATLGEQKNTWDWSSNNWNNCQVNTQEKEACLGVYTSSNDNEDLRGAVVNDFTSESAARDASMQMGDVILSINQSPTSSHQEVWDEIAKYKPGEKVAVEYARAGKTKVIEATLKACKNNSSRVTMTGDDNGNVRQFSTWNWNQEDNDRLRTRQVITIRRGDGDAPQMAAPPPSATSDRSLQLTNFKAYPNPSQGQVTIEFNSEAMPTTVTLYDVSGKQLFSEELNGFDGTYNQQFDLSAYAKGTILVQVSQDGKLFVEQIVVN